VALGAADIVSPVLASAEIIVGFFSFVTGKAGVGHRFGVEILKINDLGLIPAAFHVGLTRSVARLATHVRGLLFSFAAAFCAALSYN
jgi:hypothetical protein